MTLVEFFDSVAIENMASCLAMRPDRVVFVGENKPMKKQEKIFYRLAEEYDIDVSFEYKSISKNSIDQIVSALTEIVESDEKCIFDLTGGEDLVLVAMGIVYERYRDTEKIQMHSINIRTGTIYDCDRDGIIPDYEPPKLTVNDSIMLYGGCIVPFDGQKGTYDWNFSEDFESDLFIMWGMCKRNPGLWNTQIGTLACISDHCSQTASQLDMFANKKHIETFMDEAKKKYIWLRNMIKAFYDYGLIEDLNDEEETVSFRFKNEQVKHCLTKEGTLLELMVLLMAAEAADCDGEPKFNDIVNGVYIDWDSTIHDASDEEKDTENEIDVVLMKGMIPIFISCKNGYVDESELYKLNTVAEKFGGPYAQKVLVTTYYSKNITDRYKYFVQRAKDMKIQLIENVHELSDEEFAKKIKNILC